MSTNATNTADSRELEDLFDSIALAPDAPEPATAAAEPPAAPQIPAVMQIHALRQPPAALKAPAALESPAALETPAGPPAEAAGQDEKVHGAQPPAANKVINSVGLLTRQLHDTLAELGFDRHLQEAAAGAMPDARQRLAYVVTLTEQAASRSLNAVELATPVQEKLAADAVVLAANWDSIFRGESDVGQFRKIAEATRDYLHTVPQHTQTTREQLREIVLAQEFQDLTGQVLKRITELANNLETQLLTLLVENSPTPVRRPDALGILSGPQIGAATADVAANQEQVDELLESLGF
jgi:chemotaxis protein CheZ